MTNKKISVTKSRSKFYCPDALARLISLANCVQPGALLPDSGEIFERYRDEFENEEGFEECAFDRAVRRTYKDCFELLKPHAAKFFFEERAREIPQHRSHQEIEISVMFGCLLYDYPNIKDVREGLIEIAKYFERLRSPDEGDNWLTPPLPTIPTELVADGTCLQPSPNSLMYAISGVNCDAIRICKICEQLFWARRDVSTTDSIKCRNTLLQRSFRKKQKDAVQREHDNKRRRENREYKNAKGKK